MASDGVALALTRDVRSAAMQETAAAAVGQPCEPFDTKHNEEFCLSCPNSSRLRKLLATELSWDRSGDHNTTPRRPEGDVEPHRVCLLVCYLS